ncbi:MAG: hypothetical protein GY830_06690 [Bacteroidetes bacterium]|nr:hypothetical protein [Bacteroidota bacterium]
MYLKRFIHISLFHLIQLSLYNCQNVNKYQKMLNDNCSEEKEEKTAKLIQNEYESKCDLCLMDVSSDNDKLQGQNLSFQNEEFIEFLTRYGCYENVDNVKKFLNSLIVFPKINHRIHKKYIDLNNFYCKYDFCRNDTLLLSIKDIRKLMIKINQKRKSQLFEFLDCNIFLNECNDIKKIIIDYFFSENLEALFKKNERYRDFIYKKIVELEFYKRKDLGIKVIKKYRESSEISYYDFKNLYADLRCSELNFNFKKRTCLLRSKPIKRLFFFERILLRMENKVNTKLKKRKYSICCLVIPALTLRRIIGTILLLALVITMVILYSKSSRYNTINMPNGLLTSIILLPIFSFFLIPLLLLLIDPGYMNIRKGLSKCKYKLCCAQTYKQRKNQILDLSNKRNIIDVFCCTKYEEFYPGLRKKNPFIKCLCISFKCIHLYSLVCCGLFKYCFDKSVPKIKKLFPHRCKNLNCNLQIISKCCLSLKKILNIGIIDEEELLNQIYCNEDNVVL